jgi:hypothetical protein
VMICNEITSSLKGWPAECEEGLGSFLGGNLKWKEGET